MAVMGWFKEKVSAYKEYEKGVLAKREALRQQRISMKQQERQEMIKFKAETKALLQKERLKAQRTEMLAQARRQGRIAGANYGNPFASPTAMGLRNVAVSMGYKLPPAMAMRNPITGEVIRKSVRRIKHKKRRR